MCIAIAKSGAVTAYYAIRISAKFVFFTAYYMIRITLYFGCEMSSFSIGFHVVGMSSCITAYNWSVFIYFTTFYAIGMSPWDRRKLLKLPFPYSCQVLCIKLWCCLLEILSWLTA